MSFESKNPVPVFPLPGTVLFPGVYLPLHVFEARYRALVREALAAARLVALALLMPGWERDYQGSPEFHPLGCLARIDEVAWLPDDCYRLRLLGLERVRLGRPVREFPYRAVRAEAVPQEPFSEDDALIQLERRALIETAGRFARLAESAGGEPRPVEEALGFEPLVNSLCMGLAMGPGEKLALLAMDSVLERGRRAREVMEDQILHAGRGEAAGGERN
ncbi:MAG: LON peptidase substrate-binding domain-containing protein [Candidatus Eiseniibacteriota bacterium]